MQKKGILIVSFGTSHVSTRQKTIGAVEETTRRIAMAALKDGDLSNQPTKD